MLHEFQGYSKVVSVQFSRSVMSDCDPMNHRTPDLPVHHKLPEFTQTVVWYSHLLQNFPQYIVIHTVEGFGVVNTAEIDVFRELSCFFDDPADIGNLISGSSTFSKTSLNIWKFSVHVLLKPGLENFEHYFTSV